MMYHEDNTVFTFHHLNINIQLYIYWHSLCLTWSLLNDYATSFFDKYGFSLTKVFAVIPDEIFRLVIIDESG